MLHPLPTTTPTSSSFGSSQSPPLHRCSTGIYYESADHVSNESLELDFFALCAFVPRISIATTTPMATYSRSIPWNWILAPKRWQSIGSVTFTHRRAAINLTYNTSLVIPSGLSTCSLWHFVLFVNSPCGVATVKVLNVTTVVILSMPNAPSPPQKWTSHNVLQPSS